MPKLETLSPKSTPPFLAASLKLTGAALAAIMSWKCYRVLQTHKYYISTAADICNVYQHDLKKNGPNCYQDYDPDQQYLCTTYAVEKDYLQFSTVLSCHPLSTPTLINPCFLPAGYQSDIAKNCQAQTSQNSSCIIRANTITGRVRNINFTDGAQLDCQVN